MLANRCVVSFGSRHTDTDGSNSCADVFRYGCLYDVMVEVLPTQNSEILQVLDDKGACTKSVLGFCLCPGSNIRREAGILYPGSRLLVMAQVRLMAAFAA